MLTNYLKITWAVMKRRTFFTFISLFGISLTLTILIVLTAFYEHAFSGNYPEVNRERTLFASNILMEQVATGFTSSSPLSIFYIHTYLKTLQTPEKVAFATGPNTTNTYYNGKKLRLYFKFTDPVFWEIMQFDFLEGKPYTQREVDNNESVVVINDKTRDDYFGKDVAAVGRSIDLNGQNLRVIGVVRGCPITRQVAAADLYLPYHLQKHDPHDQRYTGGYTAIVMARHRSDLARVKTEYADVVARVPVQPLSDFTPDRVESRLSSYFESTVTDPLFRSERGLTMFYLLAGIFALMFMTLPAINLVNINISRIMERASEIGIRKAFGASARTMTAQFVVENVIVTLIGGGLALLLSALFLAWFNQSDLIAYADLRINWTVVGMAVALSLVFGLMSGVYPAWRMSKLPVVEALRG